MAGHRGTGRARRKRAPLDREFWSAVGALALLVGGVAVMAYILLTVDPHGTTP